MARFWRRTMEYLGLIDDAEVQQQEGSGATQPRITPHARTERAVRTLDPAETTGRQTPSLRPPGSSVQGRRVDPPQVPRRTMPASEAGVVISSSGNQASPALTTPGTESVVVSARVFDDAKEIADHLKNRTPVVLDLRAVEPEMVRRLVDFSSGLVYALDGTMRKIAQGVILVSPPRVTLSRTERRRLADLGLYETSDAE